MISVEEAEKIIQSHLITPETEEIPFEEAAGRVLVEPISADRDFPPFNRVMMDGIAINADFYLEGQRLYDIEGTQLAGSPQLSLKNENNCIEVMTGSVLPKGVDTVIRYEDVTIEGSKAVITELQIVKGQNVHAQGKDIAKDKIIIQPNTLISSAEIGVITTVGKTTVRVYKPLKFAIISTGDELVDVSDQPKAYQIRKSNSYVLKSSLDQLKMISDVFHLDDDKEVLKATVGNILEEYDVLILSGGVSKGKSDFVPEVLDELNVQKHFHRVAQRPGKPFWYGTKNQVSVFALPGNPVSTYLCFNKYIVAWIKKGYGLNVNANYVQLTENFSFKPELTNFLQVKVRNDNGTMKAEPVPGLGSGDLANLVLADGFIELPSERSEFKKGEVFHFIPYRRLE